MNDIKFRAWCEEKRVMTICRSLTEWLDAFSQFEYDTKSNQIEFMRKLKFLQYTGLKDKNAEEIYEGDLLEDEEKQLWEVSFDNGGYRVTNVFMPGSRYIDDDLIIVGNIYENSELIEKYKLKPCIE